MNPSLEINLSALGQYLPALTLVIPLRGFGLPGSSMN